MQRIKTHSCNKSTNPYNKTITNSTQKTTSYKLACNNSQKHMKRNSPYYKDKTSVSSHNHQTLSTSLNSSNHK